MGNHEYCMDCGASDFHHGRPCNPERLAAEQTRQQEIKDRVKSLDKSAERVCAALVALGYPAKIGQFGHIVLEKWDLKENHGNLSDQGEASTAIEVLKNRK